MKFENTAQEMRFRRFVLEKERLSAKEVKPLEQRDLLVMIIFFLFMVAGR